MNLQPHRKRSAWVGARRPRAWIAWCALIALAGRRSASCRRSRSRSRRDSTPRRIGTTAPRGGRRRGARASRQRSAHDSSSRAHGDFSDLPGSPTHPLDHDCDPCQVLTHLSRCIFDVALRDDARRVPAGPSGRTSRSPRARRATSPPFPRLGALPSTTPDAAPSDGPMRRVRSPCRSDSLDRHARPPVDALRRSERSHVEDFDMISQRSAAPPARVPVALFDRVCRHVASGRCRRARVGRQTIFSGHAHDRRPVRRGRTVAADVVRAQDARERRRAGGARDGVLGRRHEARDRELRHRLRRELRQGAAGRRRDRARLRQPRARHQVPVLPERRARIDPVRRASTGTSEAAARSASAPNRSARSPRRCSSARASAICRRKREYLRPLAVTGQFGIGIPTRSSTTTTGSDGEVVGRAPSARPAVGFRPRVQLAVPAVVRAGCRAARAVQPDDPGRRVRDVDRARSRRERDDGHDQSRDHLGRPYLQLAAEAHIPVNKRAARHGMDRAAALLPRRPVPEFARPSDLPAMR